MNAKSVLALAGLLLAAGLLLFFSGGRRSAPADLSAPQTSPASAENSGAPLAPALEPSAESGGTSERRVAEVASPESVAEIEVPVLRLGDEPLVATGLFRLVHPDGSTDETQGGTAEFVVWVGDSGEHEQHPIVAGRFRFEVPPGAELAVRRVRLGGAEAALLEPRARYAVTGEDEGGAEPIVVEVERPPTLALHVTDADSGLHLDRVTVVVERPVLFGIGTAAYPDTRDPDATIAEDASSPVHLVPSADLVARHAIPLHVGSPGYAWGRVVVEFAAGGERSVALERGAGADVFLDGAPAPSDALLRVRRGESHAPDLERRLFGATEVALEGLHPGEHTVTVELGTWYGDSTALARATFTADPAIRTRVVLTLAADDVPRPAHLSGSLTLPPYWAERNDALILEPLDGSGFVGGTQLPFAEMERAPGRDDLYHWSAGHVNTGRYELRLPTPRASIVIDLGPEGERDALLEVAPPAALSVEVVDGITGQRIEGGALSWRTIWPEGVGGGWEQLERDLETGRFELVAPAGDVELMARVPGYLGEGTRTIVSEGGGSFTLRASRLYELTVYLQAGDKRIPLPGLDTLELEFVDGGGDGTGGRIGFGTHGAGRTFVALDRPGRYRFRVPQLEGFATIPVQEVEVGGTEPIEHVIELVAE